MPSGRPPAIIIALNAGQLNIQVLHTGGIPGVWNCNPDNPIQPYGQFVNSNPPGNGSYSVVYLALKENHG